MRLKEVVEALDLTVVCGEEWLERKVSGGYAGDLLSVVMGKAGENAIWITVQSHINIIAVAMLSGVACVIVSEGFSIDEDAISKAIEEEVVLITSKDSTYSLCSKLGKLGI